MRVIEIDGSDWRTPLDALEGMLSALGAPDWHGRNLNALSESIVYGGINSLEAPFSIRIQGTKGLPESVREMLSELAGAVADALAERRARNSEDLEIQFEGDF